MADFQLTPPPRYRYDHGKADFYPTPGWVTEALLKHHPPRMGRVVEPAAGDGAIVRVLVRLGYEVFAWDIRDTTVELLKSGAKLAGVVDWLDKVGRWGPGGGPNAPIVTNPPFSIAREFATACLKLEPPYCALLLRLNVLASGPWRKFWVVYPPTSIIFLTRRPSFTGDGKTDACNYGWVVWEEGYHESTKLIWA
jgi:hypothetical protein